MKQRVLVVDDEPNVREALRQIIEFEEVDVRLASSGGEALLNYPELRPQVVFLDVKMAGIDGLETLTRLRALDPGAVVVMISGHGTIATALEATRRGAFDFLEKPLDAGRLVVVLRNALEQAALVGENRRLRGEVESRFEMIGESAGLKAVREVITRVGPTAARVLITGENGTGKELVARAIHGMSPRRKAAFVEVNCAAIPSELIESELFGHIKGSFTGAVSDRPGKFEQADEGTLFLDEVGDMSSSAQAKVLRALQEGVISRVGGGQAGGGGCPRHRCHQQEYRSGDQRRSFSRGSVLPPQRSPHPCAHPSGNAARTSPLWSDILCASWRAEPARPQSPSRPPRSTGWRGVPWSGNVRELRNAVERLLILSSGKVVTAGDVGRLLGEGSSTFEIPDPPAGNVSSYEAFRDAVEKKWLDARLTEHHWNVARDLQGHRHGAL